MGVQRMVPETVQIQVPQTTYETQTIQVPKMVPQETTVMVPQTTTEMVETQVPKIITQEVETVVEPVVSYRQYQRQLEPTTSYGAPVQTAVQQTYAAPATTYAAPTMSYA